MFCLSKHGDCHNQYYFTARQPKSSTQVIEDVLFLENWNPLPFLVVPPNYKALKTTGGFLQDFPEINGCDGHLALLPNLQKKCSGICTQMERPSGHP
jgi:hypothetical protein